MSDDLAVGENGRGPGAKFHGAESAINFCAKSSVPLRSVCDQSVGAGMRRRPSSPSLAGVSEAALEMRCVGSMFSAGATARQSSCPFVRSTQKVTSFPSSRPVRKIRLPTMHSEGMPVWHLDLPSDVLLRSNSTGGSGRCRCLSPRWPRNCGHSESAAVTERWKSRWRRHPRILRTGWRNESWCEVFRGGRGFGNRRCDYWHSVFSISS